MYTEITTQAIIDLFERQNKEHYRLLGGVDAFAKEFETDLINGLSEQEKSTGFKLRKEKYGVNVLPDPPQKSWWYFFWEAFQSFALQILFVSAVLSLILTIAFPSAHGNTGSRWLDFVDTLAIFFAVFIVMFIQANTNYIQQKAFAEINKLKNDYLINVVRGGIEMQISNMELLVGDVLSLKNGDKVAADCLYINGHALKIDNSQETGESVAVTVDKQFPFILGGAAVESGDSHALVCAVGPSSQSGVNMMKIQKMDEETRQSPLERKLDVISLQMTWIGLIGASMTFIVLLIKWIIDITGKTWDLTYMNTLVEHLMVGITIFICAVPEGLPLAVTLSLGFSMKWMVKDNNFVRHLSACETMGGATTICSDKTGTLTKNEMTVVKFLMNYHVYDDYPELKNATVDLFAHSIALNTNAYLTPGTPDVPPRYVGQSSECALLQMLPHYQMDYRKIREEHEIGVLHEFNSTRKRMSTVVKHGTGWRAYVKGAPDFVLQRCNHYINEEGEMKEFNEDLRNAVLDHVIDFADAALRTILIAYRDMPGEENDPSWQDADNVECNLIMIGIAGIIDPLRPEVPGAIAQCKRAGVTVRMVTGDYINTAKAIAKDCGIFDDDGIAMSGLEFSSTSKLELLSMLPKLQVLARSSPRDKYRLVGLLMECGEVVAVTGDGSNDSPALKRANVGLSMGKCGTELAKMASDIVILDDNFSSIVSALKWGRCVYDNVRGFLQFQLVVNFTAMLTAFIGSIFMFSSPLKAIQLLWTNLIVGPVSSMALATSKPVEALLERHPYGAEDPVISTLMKRNILGQVIYELTVLFLILFGYKSIFGFTGGEDRRNTMVFNTFVYCQVFNLINSRVTGPNMRVTEGLFTNPYFIFVFFALAALQAVIVEFAGSIFVLVPLPVEEWLTCVGFGIGILIVGFGLRKIKIRDLTKERLLASRELKKAEVEAKYRGMRPEEMWDVENTPKELENEELINP